MTDLDLNDLDIDKDTNTNLFSPSELLGKALRVILKQRENLFTSVGAKTFIGPSMKGVKRQMFTNDDGEQCIKSLGRKPALATEEVYDEVMFHIDNPKFDEADAINEFLHYLS